MHCTLLCEGHVTCKECDVKRNLKNSLYGVGIEEVNEKRPILLGYEICSSDRGIKKKERKKNHLQPHTHIQKKPPKAFLVVSEICSCKINLSAKEPEYRTLKQKSTKVNLISFKNRYNIRQAVVHVEADVEVRPAFASQPHAPRNKT